VGLYRPGGVVGGAVRSWACCLRAMSVTVTSDIQTVGMGPLSRDRWRSQRCRGG
jgi:hypothetical protein